MTLATERSASASSDSAAARPLELLLLCDYRANGAITTAEHIFALRDYSRHKVRVLSSLGNLPFNLDLSRFDGIIIHYSLVAAIDSFISRSAREAIRSFPGLKIAFVQDDYRFIDMTVAALRYMGINAIFGLASQAIVDQVYSPSALPGVRRETVLAGYVPENLTKLDVPRLSERPIDVGYRARKLAYWLGSHAQQKWVIAEKLLQDAPRYGLRCDISTRESDRIYGQAWIDFVTSCKAMLGTESGSSVCDFTGKIQRDVEAHLLRDPNASYEEVRDLYFRDEDGRIMMNVISPRCFEAAALRTLMVLYEGDYSGRLQAWRHYVPLARDHSNMDEVVSIIRDPERAQKIVDCAFEEVALNPINSFRSMVEQVDRAVDACFVPAMTARTQSYTVADFRKVEAAARYRYIIRDVVFRAVHILAPRVEQALGIFPADTKLRLHRRLQKFWRTMIALDAPWNAWRRGPGLLIKAFGLHDALRLIKVEWVHPRTRADMTRAATLVLASQTNSGLTLRLLCHSERGRLEFALNQAGKGGGPGYGPTIDELEALSRNGQLREIECHMDSWSQIAIGSPESAFKFEAFAELAQSDRQSQAVVLRCIAAGLKSGMLQAA